MLNARKTSTYFFIWKKNKISLHRALECVPRLAITKLTPATNVCYHFVPSRNNSNFLFWSFVKLKIICKTDQTKKKKWVFFLQLALQKLKNENQELKRNWCPRSKGSYFNPGAVERCGCRRLREFGWPRFFDPLLRECPRQGKPTFFVFFL